MKTLLEEIDMWVDLMEKGDHDAQRVAGCLRRARVAVDRLNVLENRVAHDEMYGRRSGSRLEALFR